MAATTRAPRKASTPKSVTELNQDVPDVIKLTTKTPDKTDRVPLFELDGVEYSVPRRPGLGLGIKFLRSRRKHGEMDAALELLEELLGEDAFDKLTSYPDLRDEDLATVLERATVLVLGRVEVNTPN